MFRQDEIAQENGQSATIGIKQWLVLDLVSLLNIIPIVGSIAALIIYIVIAVRNDTAPSMKSRIIMSLIWAGIFIVLGLILMTLGVFSLATIATMD